MRFIHWSLKLLSPDFSHWTDRHSVGEVGTRVEAGKRASGVASTFFSFLRREVSGCAESETGTVGLVPELAVLSGKWWSWLTRAT